MACTIALAKGTLARATKLSWKMLAFSGFTKARPRPLDLSALVSGWAEGQDPEFRARRLALACAEVPQISADPEQVLMLLDELLLNAREAMVEAGLVEGQVRVRVFRGAAGSDAGGFWVAERPGGGDTICLEVANDGTRPDDEILGRMFDPFFSTKFTGRGMGLPSLLGILKVHGAGLQVLPQGEADLAFRIHFPL